MRGSSGVRARGDAAYRAPRLLAGTRRLHRERPPALLFTNHVDIFESVSVGGDTAAERANTTALLPDAAEGFAPVGTRFVDVTLAAIRSDGTGLEAGLCTVFPVDFGGSRD